MHSTSYFVQFKLRNDHTKQILIGNFKTQSHVLCMAFFVVEYPRQIEMSQIVL